MGHQHTGQGSVGQCWQVAPIFAEKDAGLWGSSWLPVHGGHGYLAGHLYSFFR